MNCGISSLYILLLNTKAKLFLFISLLFFLSFLFGDKQSVSISSFQFLYFVFIYSNTYLCVCISHFLDFFLVHGLSVLDSWVEFIVLFTVLFFFTFSFCLTLVWIIFFCSLWFFCPLANLEMDYLFTYFFFLLMQVIFCFSRLIARESERKIQSHTRL